MKHTRYALLAVAVLLLGGSIALSACAPEEPEEHHYSEYDDSTGLEITDSITVIFKDKKWKTLDFTAQIESEETSVFKWATVKAHKPGSRYPAFYLRMYLGEGNHTTHMSFNDPGLGYLIPGTMVGDVQGGAIYYYENREVSSPDGTKTSDWWPLEVTTSVLKYDDETGALTARVTATMFDYYRWVTREVQSVDSCETCEMSVTFGGLSIRN